jgi:uncharacterized protein (TIGR00369 family)
MTTPVRPLEPVLERISMSPLGRLLGFELVEWAPDRVVIKMPFKNDITTLGDLVHGGAIAALADTTATAVAWSGVDPASPPQRGTTVSLAVDFMAGARARDLLAEGTVARRGKTLCFCNVAVRNSDGELVSQARAVYKLG